MKPYPAYKDSGVPALGDIPAHWDVCQLGRFGQLLKGNGGTKDDQVSNGVPCVRYGDIYMHHQFCVRKSHSYVPAERARDYTPIRYGDILFAGSGETIEEIGKSVANLMECEACCGGDIVVFRPFGELDAPFMGYASNCNPVAYQKSSMGRGITVMHLYGDELKQLWIVLPPLCEQRTISGYLDYMDRRVRRYIRAKQRLIKLLEEQKQTILQEAVTRGLDPKVRLKPSGVEWLGDIPKHWEVRRLHQLTDVNRPIMYGIVLPGPNVDDGVPIVKGGNCEPGRLRPELLARTTFEIEARYARSRLRAGDVVIAIRGGVGGCELVTPEVAGANLTQDAARIAPGQDVCSKWLLCATQSRFFQAHLGARVVGATVRGINIRDLKRVMLPFPPLSEQQLIASHLEQTLAPYTRAVNRAQVAIELLGEYRTRLIGDVVTGALDVREAADYILDDGVENAALQEESPAAECSELDDDSELEPDLERVES